MTSTHFLPISSDAFREFAQGRQHALCLPTSEGIDVGDYLLLRERREAFGGKLTYSGAWLVRRVSGALSGEGIETTHAVYSLATGVDSDRATVAFKRQLGLAEQQGVSAERFFRHREKKERARRESLRRASERVVRVRAASAREAESR